MLELSEFVDQRLEANLKAVAITHNITRFQSQFTATTFAIDTYLVLNTDRFNRGNSDWLS